MVQLLCKNVECGTDPFVIIEEITYLIGIIVTKLMPSQDTANIGRNFGAKRPLNVEFWRQKVVECLASG